MTLVLINSRTATVLRRISSRDLRLMRTASQSPEAVERGGGYVYSTHPDGKAVTATVGRFLIAAGFVVSDGDDLFFTTIGGGAAFRARRSTPCLSGA